MSKQQTAMRGMNHVTMTCHLSSEKNIGLARDQTTDLLFSSLQLFVCQFLGFSKLKEFADDNLKFDENGSRLYNWVENTEGKGEIARYEQFLLSHSVFKRLILQTHKNQGFFDKELKCGINRMYSFILKQDKDNGKFLDIFCM